MFLIPLFRLSKFTVVLLVLLSSSACSRLQIGGFNQPDVVEGNAPVVDSGSRHSVYTVQNGDNLYLIGKRYGLRYQDIATWNRIPPPFTIRPGQQLVLAPGMTPPAPMPSSEPQVLVFDWDTGSVRPETSPQPVQAQPAPTVITEAPVMEFDWQTGQPRSINAPVGGSAGGVEQALYYTVKSGDTLSLIAKQYGVTYQDLADLNAIAPPYRLKVGQSLLVSANNTSRSLMAMSAMDTPYSDYGNNPLPPDTIGTTRYHRVQQGETLYSIARSYGLTYQDVAAWNAIPAPYHLRVGQSLQLSPSSNNNMPLVAAASSAAIDGHYTVARGDTLSAVARRFNRSVSELAAWNGLQKPYPLTVGQQLTVSPQMSIASSRAAMPVSSPTIEPQRVTVSVAKPAADVEQNLLLASSNAANTGVRKTLRGEIIYHAVQKGETLASIAHQYAQNSHELALWNGIAPPYPIYPGQTIMIYR